MIENKQIINYLIS